MFRYLPFAFPPLKRVCSATCSDAYLQPHHPGSWGGKIRMQNQSRLCGRDLATNRWARSVRFICSFITRVEHSFGVPLFKSFPCAGGGSLARVFSHSAGCLFTLLTFPLPGHAGPSYTDPTPFISLLLFPRLLKAYSGSRCLWLCFQVFPLCVPPGVSRFHVLIHFE